MVEISLIPLYQALFHFNPRCNVNKDNTRTKLLIERHTKNPVFIAGVISAEVLAWVVLDNTFLKPYTTYLFTPYLVMMWTLIGIVYKIWDFNEPIFLFAGSILILSVGKLFGYLNKILCTPIWFKCEQNNNE